MATPLRAQTLAIAANAGVASDYVFRGVDESDGRVEEFAGLDLNLGRVYVGTWASNVDLRRFGDPSASAEVDAYAGWRPSLFGYDLDVGAIAYNFVNPTQREDYVEAYGKASRIFGPLTAGVSLYASPQYPRAAGAGAYVEGKASYAVTRNFTATLALGDQVEAHALAPAPCLPTQAGCAGPYRTLNFVDWSLVGAFAVSDRLGLELRYTDTDDHGLGSAYHSRIEVTARTNFP